MAEIIMPKMGDAMEEGTLVTWLKKVGDQVASGEAIAEIETDKLTMEMEAQEDGFLTSIIAEEGAVVPIGEPIGTIGPEDEVGKVPPPAAKAAPAEVAAPAAEAAPATEAPAAAAAPAPAAAETKVPNTEFRASPYVRKLARENNLDLSLIDGTGPNGRIVSHDVLPYINGEKPLPTAAGAPTADAAASDTATPAATSKGELVSMPKIKRITGQRMSESKAEIPHYYVSADIDMTEAMTFRKDINAKLADAEAGVKVSVNDMIIKAAAMALVEHPNLNREYVGDELYQMPTIDINIAIAMDGGLIAPFIPSADQKSLGTISKMAKDLGKRAREGGLTLEEYQGGTFTITNLGMFNVDEFIAVINPPQVAILAVGSTVEVPMVKNGEIVIGQKMKLTVSADHRAMDGAEVAMFLQTVRKYLENPVLLTVG